MVRVAGGKDFSVFNQRTDALAAQLAEFGSTFQKN
jgi:hypothetical protein